MVAPLQLPTKQMPQMVLPPCKLTNLHSHSGFDNLMTPRKPTGKRDQGPISVMAFPSTARTTRNGCKGVPFLE